MTLPAPVQDLYSVGEVLTAASMNKNVHDAVTFLANPPIALVTQSVVQSIPNNAATNLAFDGSTIDTYGGHSNAVNNSRYTVQVPGWYHVLGTCAYSTLATNVRELSFAVNGVAVNSFRSQVQATGFSTITQCIALINANAGDFITTQALQNSGSAVPTNGNNTSMALFWVHA